MPKENTTCTGENCCTGPNGNPYISGAGALNTYFRWTGGVKTPDGGSPSYEIGQNATNSERCGGSKKGGATCYNDCCFTQMLYCDHNGPNSPDSANYQLCMHQRGCSKFVFPQKPMSGSDCTSAEGCGPALTTIEAGKVQEIKCDNGPKSQCKQLCPDDSQQDITNALNYTNKCATFSQEDEHCSKEDYYGDTPDPKRACAAPSAF